MLFLLALASAAPEDVETSTPSTPASEPTDGEASSPTETSPVLELPSLEDALPSALDVPKDLPDDEMTLSDFLKSTGMELSDFERPKLIRASWFVRPLTSISQLIGDDDGGRASLRLGVEGGRRWSTLRVLPIQVLAEAGVRASLPTIGARGHRVEGFGHIGPWLGPVRIQLGLRARWEREQWRRRTLDLSNALMIGPETRVALDAKYVMLHVGLMPLFQVAGNRTSPGDSILPALGTETVWLAGLGVPLGAWGIRAQTEWRETQIGTIVEVGAAVSFDLGASLTKESK